VRVRVEAQFVADPDTSRVGVVAARTDDLATQLLAPDDLAATVTAPRGERHLSWDLPLPLHLAARRLLEQCAPEWPAFDLEATQPAALDLPTLAGEIAGRIIDREAGRSYRGDKRRAYQALRGQERAIADLVARVSAHGGELDLDQEITRIARAAA
jgi:hypothetical protein